MVWKLKGYNLFSHVAHARSNIMYSIKMERMLDTFDYATVA